MNRTTPYLLVAALLVGSAGNLMAQGPDGPGAGMLLFFVAVAAGVGIAARAAGIRLQREALGWLGAGLLLSLVSITRASPHLQVATFVAVAAAFTFPALRAGAPWLARSGVGDVLESVASAMGHAALGGIRLLFGPSLPGSGARLSGLFRGWLLALPLLFVFGALFASADARFEGMVTGLFGSAVERWGSHLAVTATLSWLAAGYLSGFIRGTRVRDAIVDRLPRPGLGIVEVATVLGLLSLLFLVFVGMQLSSLFGGAPVVAATPGLTYAEHAREGFAQLALASALVLPLLLGADWVLRRASPRDQVVFQGLGILQLLLLGLVLASATQRVRIYQDAYGLTEARFYGLAFLGWIAFLATWLGWSVLRERRDRFAPVALVSAYVLLAALGLANPDARIARWNLERDGVSPAPTLPAAPEPRVDAAYLVTLSADAVPTILEGLPHMAPEERRVVAEALLARWDVEAAGDWRAWNLSDARVRRDVRARAEILRGFAGP